jgi:hypothetical protein
VTDLAAQAEEQSHNINNTPEVQHLLARCAERIAELERERDALKVEYESRAIWIDKMNKILGYDNSDGFHSSPSPHELAEALRAESAARELLEKFDYYLQTRHPAILEIMLQEFDSDFGRFLLGWTPKVRAILTPTPKAPQTQPQGHGAVSEEASR